MKSLLLLVTRQVSRICYTALIGSLYTGGHVVDFSSISCHCSSTKEVWVAVFFGTWFLHLVLVFWWKCILVLVKWWLLMKNVFSFSMVTFSLFFLLVVNKYFLMIVCWWNEHWCIYNIQIYDDKCLLTRCRVRIEPHQAWKGMEGKSISVFIRHICTHCVYCIQNVCAI